MLHRCLQGCNALALREYSAQDGVVLCILTCPLLRHHADERVERLVGWGRGGRCDGRRGGCNGAPAAARADVCRYLCCQGGAAGTPWQHLGRGVMSQDGLHCRGQGNTGVRGLRKNCGDLLSNRCGDGLQSWRRDSDGFCRGHGGRGWNRRTGLLLSSVGAMLAHDARKKKKKRGSCAGLAQDTTSGRRCERKS